MKSPTFARSVRSAFLLFSMLAAGPTTTPSSDDDVAIARLLAHPSDENARKPFADPRLQDIAWPVLAAAVRDGKLPTGAGVFVYGVTAFDFLDAMAHINGPRSADLVMDIARHSSDAGMRRRAVYLMESPLELRTAAARKVVVEALADPDGSVVKFALMNIERLSNPNAGPAVLEILRHPPAKTVDEPYRDHSAETSKTVLRRSALDAIGHTGYAPAVDDLLVLTTDPDADARRIAAAALADCGLHDPDAKRHARTSDRLAALMDDVNATVRSTAAGALADLGDRRAMPALVHELTVEGTFDAAHPPEGYLRLFATISRLEKLAHADYGSSLGREQWDVLANGDHDERLPVIHRRVEGIVTDLRKRGFTDDGYPRLPTTLTAADKAVFDRWFASWLVDPKGKKLVSFDYPDRTCWGTTATGKGEGWSTAGDGPERVVTSDGCTVADASHIEPIDLARRARTVVSTARTTEGRRRDRSDLFDQVINHRRDLPSTDAECVQAAWLYRLGDESLSAQLLFLSRGSSSTYDGQLNEVLDRNAWSAFSAGVNAYMVRADDVAVAQLDHLRRLYPDRLDRFGTAKLLMAELDRRKKDGHYFPHAPGTGRRIK